MVPKPDQKIVGFVKKVKKKYRIEKAILFGSRARGDYLNTSDYDIIFVSKDFAGIKFYERMSNLYEFWDHYPLEIEPFCYTPEEFEVKRKQIGTIRTAVREGIEI